ncbi:ComEA family DNA-binding protein [Salinimonas chungwhensis]|uniref:ComEA family DNA-binding protein n=1 Tax=Salinimonas chungwhensis TaxID=265425 RepID=UPI00037F31C6|nr:ComEA family DNA-binding protein [Salinimonas chungwhensis]
MTILKTVYTRFFMPLLCAAAMTGAPVAFAAANDSAVNSPAAAQTQSEKLDLNNVSVEQLTALPGIGKKKAQAIIDYREEMGHFLEVEQLTQVKGIGPKLLAKLEHRLKVTQ